MEDRLRERNHTCSDGRALQKDTVVDEADVAIRFQRPRSLLAQQVEDLAGQLHMLTVLNELTEVGQT